MKKIFFIAALAVSGLVMVSCDADMVERATPQSKGFSTQKENLKPTDTLVKTSPTCASDGPGDEIIIITPPKKP